MTKRKVSAKPEKEDDESIEPIDLVIKELEIQHKIVDATQYSAEILQILTNSKSDALSVGEVFPNFRRGGKIHAWLKVLRDKGIIRPSGGGDWTKQRKILLGRMGIDLAEQIQKELRPLLFISYSHKDENWKDRLLEHIAVLEDDYVLDTWSDEQIPIGEYWQKEIDDALERSVASILLISSSFLSSTFIKEEEVPVMLERIEHGFRVFPILVRPCAWQKISWLRLLQVRPANSVPLSGGSEHEIDTHLAAITGEISDLLSAGAKSQ